MSTNNNSSNGSTATIATIDQAILSKVEAAITEMGMIHKERLGIIKGVWIALVAKQHMLMLGPGGTGKSFLARDAKDRIQGSTYFETALDETSDPGQLFGPVDIKAMKDLGKYRRVTRGMLPEATIAFIDEFFNANGPVLHGLQPILNERLFHNNGIPTATPLWSAFMGTNKLNADADQSALWDRVHHRYVIRYVSERDNLRDLIRDDTARRVSTWVANIKSGITEAELHQAHDEALNLEFPDGVFDTMLDIRDELLHAGIEVSTRRIAEGYAAVLANAWLNGHTTVTTADLDVLQNMWWTLQDQFDNARGIILGATNPGEKEALELLDDLDRYKAEIASAKARDIDEQKLRLIGMEQFKNCKKVLSTADELLTKANAAGASTARIIELQGRANALMKQVQTELFDL